jgi:pyridinium-3,5-bisthiocarboxylic acid mononucleotide nickel chelatase
VGVHAWVDATSGIAGDMLLGSLIDAGADLQAIQKTVDCVIPGAVRLDLRTVTRSGQRASKLDVHPFHADPPHRSWHEIRDLLISAPLTDPIRQQALSVFTALAKAEARVHGVPADTIHFHEVGALDSIADIVGVCAALVQLRVDTLSVSTIALGAGRTSAAHGDLPVPVPAVLELAQGWRVQAGGTGELTTPTGMALISALAHTSEDLPPLTIHRTGVGAGSKDTHEHPNITRVVIGQLAPQPLEYNADAAVVLETNVDDLDPRLWPGVIARILKAGAADAWLVPIGMKKGRPAHTLTVLAHPHHAESLREIIFIETSTIGIREATVRKFSLPRGWVDVSIEPDGTIPIKIAHRGGSIVQATPEFEHVAALAEDQGRPERIILQEAALAAAKAGLVPGGAVPPHTHPEPRNPRGPGRKDSDR